ncbi:RNA polymerase sigma-70 factor [Sinomicrobium weinanense]|uniref:RNA polymerase sigma-70 factor n=1 Tax=Sinomicrobium weinanense TaxID=2842200 RepID=A0A926Q467_9FLAO|nr:RNA polymerase sigma-70 factor [Sinomicrobium weinanense]MBC9796540.1 RNA polymerase sigma-70 factor [Sinomicrobium weinanense]MBU3123073.1 RNA polymerase sigma-70 factor [Sinomicrobium weinanense]
MEVTDNRLFDLIRENNELAFHEVYNRYWQKLLVVSSSILQDREAAQDVVQDVFIRIWIKRRELEIENVNAYLYQAVKLRCFEYLRRNKINQKLMDRINHILHVNDVEESLNLKETQGILQKSIQSIPAKSLVIFRMSRDDAMSHREIAEKMQISKKAVEYHITVSLKHLRKLLTESTILFLFYFF